MSIIYWRRKTNVGYGFFLYGATVWVISIIIKVAMDMSITTPLRDWVFVGYGFLATFVFLILYLGLRTGFLESGLSYLAVLKTELKKMNFKKAIAFGIGFGAVEALVIGLSSFTNILIFILYPEMIGMIPLEQQALVLSSLNMSSWVIFAPIIERLSALFIHIFSTVLVVLSVKSKKLRYLWYSILFKAFVDGLVPILVFSLDTTILINVYLIEIPIIILGLFSYFGIKRVRGRFK